MSEQPQYGRATQPAVYDMVCPHCEEVIKIEVPVLSRMRFAGPLQQQVIAFEVDQQAVDQNLQTLWDHVFEKHGPRL